MMLEEELFSILKTGARPRSAVFRSDCRVWMAYGNFWKTSLVSRIRSLHGGSIHHGGLLVHSIDLKSRITSKKDSSQDM
ncbi:MAG: hypothetical protein CL925_17230 [Deltaproteobacteria bacterium]|nr:hypothetical protein [Deltaproteobacteria bacterium]